MIDIQPFLDSPEILLTLCQNVVTALETKGYCAGLDEKEKQLREISHSIDKLEKTGVRVPDSLRAIKTGLAIELAGKEDYYTEFKKLADGFSDLSRELNVMIGRANEDIKRTSGEGSGGGHSPDGEDGFLKDWGQVEFIGLDASHKMFSSPNAFAKFEGLKMEGMRFALDSFLRPKDPVTGVDLDRKYIVKVGEVALGRNMQRKDVQHLKGKGKVTIQRIT
jgi:hypothetical protein